MALRRPVKDGDGRIARVDGAGVVDLSLQQLQAWQPSRVSTHALETIFREGPLSRADLRRQLGTSLSTVTGAVQDLVESGLVVESGHAVSTGGRPPRLLDIAPTIGGVLAADIGGHNVRVASADLRGAVLAQRTYTVSAGKANTLRSLIVRALEHARTSLPGPVRATGVSVAGIVDPHTNRISRVDNIPGWPADDDLAWLDRFDAPLHVDNEANLAALGEHEAGIGAGTHDMLFIAIGAGIGAGLILNGTLYRGATGAAGELGLTRRGDPSETVELERVAAADALVRAYRSRSSSAVATADEVFARAGAGDREAAAAIERLVQELAIGIANAILVVNPNLVVIGGGLSAAGDALLAPLRAQIEQLVPAMPRVELSHLGPTAALTGAVRSAIATAQTHLMLQHEAALPLGDGSRRS